MIFFDAGGLRGCSVSEAAVWGMAKFLADGDWRQYGALPPTGVTGPEEPTAERIAELLHCEVERVEYLWKLLIERGAISETNSRTTAV